MFKLKADILPDADTPTLSELKKEFGSVEDEAPIIEENDEENE